MLIFIARCLISVYFMGFHPFYVGITEINYNESNHSLEITLRLFTDDFENALSKHTNLNISLINEDALKKYATQIEKYIEENLEISLSGKEAQLIYLGSEVDEEAVWSYLEIKDVQNISNVKIRNIIFFEIYETQTHLVHFNLVGRKKSYQINRSKPEAVFSL